jgi:hypothetical protein
MLMPYQERFPDFRTERTPSALLGGLLFVLFRGTSAVQSVTIATANIAIPASTAILGVSPFKKQN